MATTTAPPRTSTRQHGYARYALDGCRCYPCCFARSEYVQRRTRLIAYGRWKPWTEIGPARVHLQTLMALGYGYRTIALLTGLSVKTVRDVAAGRRHDASRHHPRMQRIRSTTAAAILAVPLDHGHLPDGALVDADLTWSRIRALIAAGYSRAWIARAAGLGPQLRLEPDRVTARNARRIERVYRDVGVRPGPSTRARNEGRRNGWPTPFDLDDEPAPARPAPPAAGRRRPWSVRIAPTTLDEPEDQPRRPRRPTVTT